MNILIADDDDLFCAVMRELLIGFGHECVAVGNGEAAWQHLLGGEIDAVISDWHMPGLSGPELCERVRADPSILYPYIIMITRRDDHSDVLAALRAGADDHISKPPTLKEIEARLIVAERVRALHLQMLEVNVALELANARLTEAAYRDLLTGLRNRLRLSEDLPDLHARFERDGSPYHVLMLDIDNFKRYNDTHGHQAGDALLAQVGGSIRCEVRASDFAYRYGGEEFLIILTNPTLQLAAVGAERIRVSAAQPADPTSRQECVTLSAGIAGAKAGESVESLVGRADAALYLAKAAGRNQLVCDELC